MVDLQPRWLQVDGRPLHARVSLAPAHASGPPLVCVHGLLVSSRYMRRAAARLAARHEVHVPDLPGYGRSARPPRVLDIPGLADALRGYLDAAGLGQAALVANSMGCQIAADFAARYPERVTHLVLLGPTVDPSTRPAPKLVLRWLLNVPLEPPTLVLIVLRDLLDMGPRRTYATFRHMLRDHVETKLPRIPAPTLVVRGTLDTTVSQSWLETVTRLLPDARLAVIPGRPHTINYNAPDQVVALVEDFLHQPAAVA